MSIKFFNHANIVRTFVSSISRKIVFHKNQIHVKTLPCMWKQLFSETFLLWIVFRELLLFGWKMIEYAQFSNQQLLHLFMICASNWCFALPSMHEKQCVRQKSTASFINDETRKGSVVHIFCYNHTFKKIVFNIPLYKS